MRARALLLPCTFALAALLDAHPHAGAQPPAFLPGLQGEVRIATDRWGIPHVRASTLPDLYCAWGWVTARDRLAQLAATRAAARGELHRWLGNSVLQADGGAQLFMLRERAAAIWARDRTDAPTRLAVERYADGINAYLAACRRGEQPWPRELAAVHALPEDWLPEDCVLLLLGLGVTLDLSFPEISESRQMREHGAAGFEARHRFEGRWVFDTIADSLLALGDFAHDPGPARSPTAFTPLPQATVEAAATVVAGFAGREADGADRASNEIVVGPRRSSTGRPLLANDPHLSLTAPGPFHLVHLTVPGVLDAAGAAVPGLPAIVSGRSRRCAWGVTALGADVIDVYADTLTADARSVRGPNGPVAIVNRPFHLAYRALGVPLPIPGMTRRYTAHGPVLAWDARHHLALSARWSAMEDERITLTRMVGLERSRDAREIASRYRSLVTPTINLVAADVDGHTIYQSVGLVPRRASDPGPGVLPGDGRHEWPGFIPADSMPAWEPPADGFAVNANNRPAHQRSRYAWPGYEWAHDRAARMSQRLAGDHNVTPEDLISVQNDVYSRAASRQLPALLSALGPRRDTLSPRVRIALDSLRNWDGMCRRSRVAPTIARSWWNAYLRRSGFEGLPGLGLAALTGEARDELRSPAGRRESPADAAAAALRLAVDTLTARLGPDVSTWRWGRAHQAHFSGVLNGSDRAGEPDPPLTPEDGDGSTVSVGGSRAPWDFTVTHGPVFRHVVDLADSTRSWVVVAPWNSATAARRGADLRRTWASHGYVPLWLDWSQVERSAAEIVRFAPPPAKH